MEEKILLAVTVANYFDPEIEQDYMGATQFKNFMACKAATLARINGDYYTGPTASMLVGSYVDAYFSGTLSAFRAQYPGLYKRDGSLKTKYQRANDIIVRMEEDELYMLLMSGQKQIIRTGEIAGVPFKIKIDCLLNADTCLEIARRFPEMASVLGPCEGAIVDQKVMRDTADIWSEGGSRPRSFCKGVGL